MLRLRVTLTKVMNVCVDGVVIYVLYDGAMAYVVRLFIC